MKRLEVPLLILAATASLVFGIVHELTATSGPDYCQMANMRSCKVSDRGEWILVTAPDKTQHMIYLKDGKIVQVQ